MSDKPEGSDTHPDSREEESEDTSKSRSLKDATHKLKAEALRRLQLGDADYDNEGAKNNEGREGSSPDENAVDTGNDGGEQSEIGPGKSDVLNKEKEGTLDVTDSRGADSNGNESRESEGFGKDSAKPNEDILGDSVVGENIKSYRQNEEGSDISAHVDGHKHPKIIDQSISKGSESLSEGENVNQGIFDKTANEGSTQGQFEGGMRDSRPGSASSRPGSGKVRPGSGSEGTRKAEGSKQKPGSRPGSGVGNRSRPGSVSEGTRIGDGSKQKPSSRPGSGAGNRSRQGSGSDKVSGGGGLERQLSRGRPGSGSGSGSQSQSSGKRGAASNDGGTVVQDGSTRGSVGEVTSRKDEASVGDRTKQTAQDVSQPKARKDNAEGATSSDNAIEGISQTVGMGSAEQGQDHHGDKSNLAGSDTVGDNNAEKSSAKKLSSDNKSESKQTGGDDKISDDVSPPMNEGTESKDQGIDSKQSSDSFSNDKQDSEAAEAGKDSKEDNLSEETKDDIQTASTSDQQGPDDAKTSEQKDASETLQGKDGSKDSTSVEGEETSAAVKNGDKDGLVTESSGEGKEQDGAAAKPGSDDAEGDKPEMKTDHGDGDQDGAEKSSNKKVVEQGRIDDASVDGAGEKKADDSEKKKKKKKVKKEGVGQEESMEEEDEEDADKTGMAGDEAQPDKGKQTESGM